jgi:hypothetical protein
MGFDNYESNERRSPGTSRCRNGDSRAVALDESEREPREGHRGKKSAGPVEGSALCSLRLSGRRAKVMASVKIAIGRLMKKTHRQEV